MLAKPERKIPEADRSRVPAVVRAAVAPADLAAVAPLTPDLYHPDITGFEYDDPTVVKQPDDFIQSASLTPVSGRRAVNATPDANRRGGG